MVRIRKVLQEADARCSDVLLNEYQSVERVLLRTANRAKDTCGEEEYDEIVFQEAQSQILDSLVDNTVIEDGLDLFNQLQNSVLLPTGINTLDHLLRGGLREEQITEISGSSPSGKTQLCHYIAANTAALDFKVIYISTNATFSSERLVHFCKSLIESSSFEESVEESLQRILSNIHVMFVHDTSSLLSVLQDVHREFALASKHDRKMPKLLIIDSPSLLLYRDQGAPGNHGRLLISYLSILLRKIIEKFHIAMLLTKLENPRYTSTSKALLNQCWDRCINVRLHLQLFSYSDAMQRVCRATLTKNSTKACGSEAWFAFSGHELTGIDKPSDNHISEISTFNM